MQSAALFAWSRKRQKARIAATSTWKQALTIFYDLGVPTIFPWLKTTSSCTNQMILADLRLGGKTRKVLMQAPKNGFFYVLDRTNGKLLSADKYAAANWATKVDLKSGRPVFTEQADFSQQDRLIYPNPNGAHDWQSISFSPRTGLVYIPVDERPWIYSTKTPFKYMYDLGVPAADLSALKGNQPPVENGGYLRAWDVKNRRIKWQAKMSTAWNSGTLATAGDLVFQATADGFLSAYDAAGGERLAHIFTGNSAISAPITYAIGETQYIALVAGYGGSGLVTVSDRAAVKTYENAGRVIVFKLGGADVPTPTKRAVPLGPPTVDTASLPPADPAVMAKGAAAYRNCMGCHGTAGSTPILPNLGRVRQIGLEGFKAIVLNGALEPMGMPSFQGRLSEDSASALFDYISRGEHNKPNGADWY